MMAMLLGGGEIIVLLMVMCLIPLGIATFVFWICMLVSAIQNKGLAEGEKIAWVLVIALLHVLGAIIYFFVRRPKRNAPLPST
ncbi:MAG: PLDc N-terminal domain-containing protein [Verrucomicrobiae bacterium]|nr:PLDc N-terminal domain-containing protein [Verrucomicrobiae bacterium]